MSTHNQIAAVGLSLLRRSLESDPNTPDTPQGSTVTFRPLTWGLILLVTIIFAPAYFFVSYSVKSVYTTLAIVENPTPAAYEAVANDETDAAPAAVPNADGIDEEASAAGPAKPITASLRRTYKYLRAANGWRGNYRGFFLAVLILILTSVGTAVVAAFPFVPVVVASLVVSLALVQLQAAWVHTVIRAKPSSTPIFRNLPPFRRTFEATAVPTFLLWAANSTIALVSMPLTRALQLMRPNVLPEFTGALVWKTAVVLLVAVGLVFVFVLPATVVLVRVQASLLPPDEDAVVPFDRSFNGTVEPAVVGGRTYVTVKDAFRSFSRASWKRVAILYIKLHLLTVLVNVLYFAAMIPIVLLGARKTDPVV